MDHPEVIPPSRRRMSKRKLAQRTQLEEVNSEPKKRMRIPNGQYLFDPDPDGGEPRIMSTGSGLHSLRERWLV